MRSLSESVLNLVNFDWLNFARQQLRTKIHYCVTNYCYSDVMDNVYAPIKNMMLPATHAVRFGVQGKIIDLLYHD
jgi:hypothetical protein